VAGGSGANTAAGLGRLGLRVATAGLVADDDDGALVRSALVDAGVVPLMAPPDGLRRPTGSALVFSDQRGRRSIYVNPGANERFASATRGAYRARLRHAVRSARIVHFSSFTLAPERRLQEALLRDLSPSALLSLKPGALYCKLGLDRLAPLLRRTNILFLDEQQLDALLGIDPPIGESMPLREKIERLYDWKGRKRYDEALAVVVNTPSPTATNGTRQLSGAAGRTGLEVIEPVHASNGLEVVMRDSTGTGDAAAAGLLWAALQGKPLHCAIDVAYVLSQSASRELGSRAGLPTARQLRRRWTRWVASPYVL
jgi:ribokinase